MINSLTCYILELGQTTNYLSAVLITSLSSNLRACVYVFSKANRTVAYRTDRQSANTGCQFIGHHPVAHSLCYNSAVALKNVI